METKTDTELIDELASRHDELIVIRPKASNMANKVELVVFCKTKTTPDGLYDLFEAIELIHDAEVGLIRDCLIKQDD